MKWSIDSMPSLQDKTIVITGGNSGLGFIIAQTCYLQGANVIITARDELKGQSAVESIQKDFREKDGTGKISFLPVDLADLSTVKNLHDQIYKGIDSLDILVNNAGIMMTPYQKTRDGFESQLGTNHMGHFALTGLLLPLLKNAPHARIVNVSSLAHTWGTMDFSNLMYENGQGYSPVKAYARSKLANLLFTYELQRKFEATNLDIIAVAAHPGVAKTDLARYLNERWYIKMLLPAVMAIMAQSSEKGALPILRALSDPEVKGGQFYGPDGFREQKGNPVIVGSSKLSHDETVAKNLWQYSEELTGITYKF